MRGGGGGGKRGVIQLMIFSPRIIGWQKYKAANRGKWVWIHKHAELKNPEQVLQRFSNITNMKCVLINVGSMMCMCKQKASLLGHRNNNNRCSFPYIIFTELSLGQSTVLDSSSYLN